jgi:hypothetical protein
LHQLIAPASLAPSLLFDHLVGKREQPAGASSMSTRVWKQARDIDHELDSSAIEKCTADSAESLGMKTGQQRHRDKDKCRRRYGKIGRFGRHITKNIAR